MKKINYAVIVKYGPIPGLIACVIGLVNNNIIVMLSCVLVGIFSIIITSIAIKKLRKDLGKN